MTDFIQSSRAVSCLILVPRNTRPTCTYRGWKMFRRGSKLKSKQLLNAVSLLSNLVSSSPPDNSCQQPKRMYYLFLIIATLSTNSCSIVKVGKWVVLPKDCNKESNNIFPNPSFTDTIRLTADILLAPANPRGAHLKPRTQQLDYIFRETHYVRRNVMKENSQFLPTDAGSISSTCNSSGDLFRNLLEDNMKESQVNPKLF